MAAEWFPVDVSLDTKPEVQELVDLTGEPVEVIVFRLLTKWGYYIEDKTPERAWNRFWKPVALEQEAKDGTPNG
jgi:hypothetical protein